jgi:Flp pilus assembly protein TadG
LGLRNKIRARNPQGVRPRNRADREKGVELLELAFVLPILLLMIAGIIDFGEAWSMKDQLTTAARNGARTAVADFNDTTNPQCNGAPCSVQAAASTVVATLNQGNVNTCGLDPTQGPSSTGTFTWTYTATCATPLSVEIEREVPLAVDGTTALYTRVTVSYPFNWGFADVAGLTGLSNSFSDTITLTSQEMMANLN